MRSDPGEKPALGRQATPLKIASIYALIGALWILLSDHAVALLFQDQPVLTWVSMLKGWFFVAVTALLVYVMVSRAFNRDRRSQEELARSEARYRLISQNTGDVIWLLDMATRRFVYVSPSVQKLRGYSAEEVMGQTMEQVLTPESFRSVSERLPSRLAGLMAGDESLRVQTREVDQFRRDGSVVHTEVVTTMLADGQGRVGQILGVSRDITDRKLAEQALRLSEEKFAKAFKSSPVWFSISTVDGGRFLEVNDAFTAISGYGREEALGRTAFELGMWPDPGERELAVRLLRDRGLLNNLEVHLRLKDGLVHDVLWSAEPMEIGGRECFISVMLDVSGQKRAQAEKAQLEAQLHQSQKMEAIGTLAGGIAHDFNNILGAVMGFGELALESARDRRDNSEEIAQILQAAERARKLVRQILTFSRKVDVELKPLDLNQSLRGTMTLLQRTIPKMIRIETRLAPDLAPVQADPNQIEQVLLNLAGNAADAMPEGGTLTFETANALLHGEPCSQCLESMEGAFTVLTVSDSGLGMSPEVLERIFEPFFTTKEVGKGTGLGLCTVYGIVKGHGGHIQCESVPGHGTVFRIYLPAQAGAAGHPAGDPGQADPCLRGRETVLLVDDDGPLMQLGARMLGANGYTVLRARSGEEALELFGPDPARLDLVILDLGMPGMGGLKCLKEMIAQHPPAKVLVASGYSSLAHMESAMKAGAAGFVAKPYRKSDLLASVREVLDGRPAAGGRGGAPPVTA